MSDELYSFGLRGLLTEEALDQSGRIAKANASEFLDQHISERLSLDLLDSDAVVRARRMATVYTAIAALENSVRQFITKKLIEIHQDAWWVTAVQESIRKKAESRMAEEAKVKWHSQRGDEPMNFTDFNELSAIITSNINWTHFEPHCESQEWVKQLFKSLERSRNVIMHSGELGNEDIERVGSCIRDWIHQVGG